MEVLPYALAEGNLSGGGENTSGHMNVWSHDQWSCGEGGSIDFGSSLQCILKYSIMNKFNGNCNYSGYFICDLPYATLIILLYSSKKKITT